MLTSGEMAKRCHVSLRTIQFYDQKGILSPSKFSNGGKRLYDEKDVQQLEMICFYRQLGFSLKEIKQLLENNNNERMNTFLNQKQILMEEKENITEKLVYMDTLLEAIQEEEQIKNMEDIKSFLLESKTYKKNTRKLYSYLILFVCIIIALGTLFQTFHLTMLFYIIIILLLLFFLVYYHANTQAYICPQCRTYFEIGFLKDLFTLNNGKKGKILRCPQCGRIGNFKERRKISKKHISKL